MIIFYNVKIRYNIHVYEIVVLKIRKIDKKRYN